MTLTVDLNADMGESFGPWVMGDDLGLLGIVTSANIACGAHAGDWDVMARTMRAAEARGVGIGAHPGYADLQGFGRRRMRMDLESLGNLVAWQLGAAQGMAASVGARVRHLKLHGALSNTAAEDLALARACYEAALRVAPEIVLMVQAATAMEEAARGLGAAYAAEIFADRAYADTGTLVDRREPGAVIHDAGAAAANMVEMVRSGTIVTASGKRIPTRIDTICLHGDTPEAVGMAATVRKALEDAGIRLARFPAP